MYFGYFFLFVVMFVGKGGKVFVFEVVEDIFFCFFINFKAFFNCLVVYVVINVDG